MSSPVRQLAERYLKNVRPSGSDNLRAECPFHHSSSSKRSLYVFTKTGAWTCFGCGKGGTIPKLLYMLGLSATRVDAALKDVDFGKVTAPSARATLQLDYRDQWDTLPEWVLGAYDWKPNRMSWWGFTDEVLQQYQVGFDEKHQRITFPIRDHFGRLAAISGRAEPGGFPRYKVYESNPPDPQQKKREGELHGAIPESYVPNNRMHLYGFDQFYAHRYFRTEEEHPPLVFVEGYKATLWMVQQGFPHTCGLQGSSLTPHQEQVAGLLRGPYYILLDHEPGKSFPDEHGRCAAYRITERLSRYSPALVCQYPEGTKIGTSPDDLSKEQLQALIDTATSTAKARMPSTQTGWARTTAWRPKT